jgi:hypothetical protein
VLPSTIFNFNKKNDISSAREQLKQYKDNFKLPLNFNPEEFRLVANGFFQAEGHISCRIKGNYFSPVFVLNQNLSTESLNFFVTLWYILGRTGNLSLTINKHNKIIIRFSSESWEIILNNYVKYFNNIYGEKYIAFQKLLDIRRLTFNNLKLNKPSSQIKEGIVNNSTDSLSDLCLAIHLVYDLSLDGVMRKISLSDQLKLFNINNSNIKLPIYKDNFTTPSILFIIGFILGDGTLHLRLRNSDKGSIWLIPTLLLPQLKNKYNAHFFSMLDIFFKSLNIKTYITNKTKNLDILNTFNNKTLSTNFNDSNLIVSQLNNELELMTEKNIKEISTISIESINTIFFQILPLIEPYSHYLYWKINQYKLMHNVAKHVKAKTHYTLYGFITIIEIIYSYPNKRLQPKEYWIKIIQSWFNTRAAKTLSGENNIQAVYGRDKLKGKIIAWKCVFPVESNIKSRQFSFSIDNIVESREALKQAIEYRDLSIKCWVDSI